MLGQCLQLRLHARHEPGQLAPLLGRQVAERDRRRWPPRAARWRRAAARASGVRCRRLTRRSLASSRRCSQPLASMRSISRPAEAFSISRMSAISDWLKPGPAIHPRDHQPLRARQPEGAHAPLEDGAHQPGHVGDGVADVVLVVRIHRLTPAPDSNLGYYIYAHGCQG